MCSTAKRLPCRARLGWAPTHRRRILGSQVRMHPPPDCRPHRWPCSRWRAAALATAPTTQPPGAALPSEGDCAGRVRRSPWEPRGENATANHTVPGAVAIPDWGGVDARANTAIKPRIDGSFTGTTDELIQWAACKWGFDEDIVRAVAVRESNRDRALRDRPHRQGPRPRRRERLLRPVAGRSGCPCAQQQPGAQGTRTRREAVHRAGVARPGADPVMAHGDRSGPAR